MFIKASNFFWSLSMHLLPEMECKLDWFIDLFISWLINSQKSRQILVTIILISLLGPLLYPENLTAAFVMICHDHQEEDVLLDIQSHFRLHRQNSIVFRDIYLQCQIFVKSGRKKCAFSTGVKWLVTWFSFGNTSLFAVFCNCQSKIKLSRVIFKVR